MFIESDVNEESSIYDAFYNKYYEGWTEEFSSYKENMKDISNIIKIKQKKSTVFPKRDSLFDALELTPLNKVRVVIWGETPYKNKNALGYAYGIPKGSPSTKTIDNIYKEIKNEIPDFKRPDHHDLQKWTEQGVLLLNMELCVCLEDKEMFSNLWVRFSEIIIQIINKKVPNCIHLLWGKRCEQLEDSISSREVFKASHPSSPYRGFYGCNHFIKTNITLVRQGKKPINW